MTRRFGTLSTALSAFDGKLSTVPSDTRAPRSENRVVVRRCRVCEWQENRVETWDADPDCPWCHGPTVAAPLENISMTLPAPAQKNPHAAALGRLGGLKGGRARAAALTAKERRDIAVRAARARWKKR